MVVAMFVIMLAMLVLQGYGAHRRASYTDPLLAYLEQNLNAEDDTFFLWGRSITKYYFLTRRAAPTRFVYPYPLLMAGYARPELVEELAADLRAHRPDLIIDITEDDDNLVPLLSDLPADLAPLTAVIEALYERDPAAPYVVYRLREPS